MIHILYLHVQLSTNFMPTTSSLDIQLTEAAIHMSGPACASVSLMSFAMCCSHLTAISVSPALHRPICLTHCVLCSSTSNHLDMFSQQTTGYQLQQNSAVSPACSRDAALCKVSEKHQAYAFGRCVTPELRYFQQEITQRHTNASQEQHGQHSPAMTLLKYSADALRLACGATNCSLSPMLQP